VSGALLCFRPKQRPRLRLVAFPWAGASAAALRPLSDAFASDDAVEVHAVAYAGRGHRKSAPLAGSLDAVVDDVVDDVAARVGPGAVYGHSFGAVVAFALAVRLEKRGLKASHVVAAARAAPSVDLEAGVAGLDDDALVALLAGYGVIDEALFADDEARALLLPPLRRDLALSEGARLDDVVDAPLTALRGRDDPAVSPEQVARWAGHTRGAFAGHVVDGGHLFVRDHAPATALVLQRVLLP
jgi:surfactin synthase thioesterase subunit